MTRGVWALLLQGRRPAALPLEGHPLGLTGRPPQALGGAQARAVERAAAGTVPRPRKLTSGKLLLSLGPLSSERCCRLGFSGLLQTWGREGAVRAASSDGHPHARVCPRLPCPRLSLPCPWT